MTPTADSAKTDVHVPPTGGSVTDTAHGNSAAGTRSWDLDWGSAGIGVATGLGAFVIVLGAAAGLPRRQIRPTPSANH